MSSSVAVSSRGRVTVLLLLALVAPWFAAPPSAAVDRGTGMQLQMQRAQRVETGTWLNLNGEYLIPGEKVVLEANVYPRVPRRVVIQRRVSKTSTASGEPTRWRKLTAGRTNAGGVLVHTFRAGTKNMDYRVVVPRHRGGGKVYSRARSKVRTVKAAEQKASLAMRVSSSGDTIEGQVRSTPIRIGRPVKIQVFGDRRWRTLAIGRLDKNGRENFTFLRSGTGIYQFRAVVRAWRGAAKVISEPQSLAITSPRDRTPPATPKDLEARPGDGFVELFWTKVSSSDVAGYVVYMRPAGTTSWSTSLVYENVGYFRARDLVNGTSYEFRVSAVDEVGNESARTGTVTAKPRAESEPTTSSDTSGERPAPKPPTSDPEPDLASDPALDPWVQLWVTWFPWLPLLPIWQ